MASTSVNQAILDQGSVNAALVHPATLKRILTRLAGSGTSLETFAELWNAGYRFPEDTNGESRERDMKSRYTRTHSTGLYSEHLRNGKKCTLCGHSLLWTYGMGVVDAIARKLGISVEDASKSRMVAHHNHETGELIGMAHSVCNTTEGDVLSIVRLFGKDAARYWLQRQLAEIDALP